MVIIIIMHAYYVFILRMHTTYSQWRTVRTGVPQGSLLGPLLFNIYMNDLNYFIKGTSLRLYADDTTAYASDPSPVVLEYIINSDLQVVCTWLQHNNLQINATKTQAMAIGPVHYRYNINLQDNIIELTVSSIILSCRVLKFSRRPAQVTGYFRHLRRVLFVFQILLTAQFCFAKVIVI